MKTPIEYPFVRDATFIANVGPSIGAAFLNKTEDGLGDLYGGLLGRSAYLVRDEFVEPDFPIGNFGQLKVLANVNGAGNMLLRPQGPTLSPAEAAHGVWEVLAAQAGSMNWWAEEAPIDQGLFDFVWSARVKILKRSVLRSFSFPGFEIGVAHAPNADGIRACFLAGGDNTRWQAVISGNVAVDTGVLIVDGEWYDLQMSRISGVVTAYIDGALVATVAMAVGYTNARFRWLFNSAAAGKGDGCAIDYRRQFFGR